MGFDTGKSPSHCGIELLRDQIVIDASLQTDEWWAWWHQEHTLGFHMSQSAASGDAAGAVHALFPDELRGKERLKDALSYSTINQGIQRLFPGNSYLCPSCLGGMSIIRLSVMGV
jgi:hypothetical protein